jgi:hypothetical protein
MKQSFDKHSFLFQPKQLLLYQVGMILVLLMIGFAHTGFLHLYERYSPTEYWYEYDSDVPVSPVETVFEKGKPLRFVSSVNYYRPVDMQWEDTMWCIQDEGLKKYDTQFWPSETGTERKTPSSSFFGDQRGEIEPF